MSLHWSLAALFFVVDVAITFATVYLDKTNTNPIPADGATDKSALIGWMSAFGAMLIFGTYAICMKNPSLEAVKADVMVFQCYYSPAAAMILFTIWLLTGASEGMTFSASSLAYGVVFAVFWIASQLFALKTVQILGFSVGPAIWTGATIVTSFLWGSLVFGNPVTNVLGAAAGLTLLLVGVRMAALSSQLNEKRSAKEEEAALAEAEQPASHGSMFLGFVCAVTMGVLNGTIMVPMTCFHQGCFGTEPFMKDQIPAMAFLPSLAAGIIIAQPFMFLLYWGPSMFKGVYPEFHAKAVAVPAIYTGLTWGMGNFNAMFATVYLGQTVGFPITQLAFVVNGCLGILYFQELTGRAPIGIFCLAAIVVFGGATLDGLFG